MSLSESTAGKSAHRDDLLLMQEVAKGRSSAFAQLVSEHGAALLRLARAISGSAADAEDIVQLTLLAAYRAADSYRGDSSLRRWLLTIARNEAVRFRAGSVRRVRDEPLAVLSVAAGWGQQDPQVLTMRSQEISRLRAALAELPSESQEILVLRDLEGLSGEETAKLLGLSVAAMKSRLHRARLRLAGVLRQGVGA